MLLQKNLRCFACAADAVSEHGPAVGHHRKEEIVTVDVAHSISVVFQFSLFVVECQCKQNGHVVLTVCVSLLSAWISCLQTKEKGKEIVSESELRSESKQASDASKSRMMPRLQKTPFIY